jgi:hypothetical protein
MTSLKKQKLIHSTHTNVVRWKGESHILKWITWKTNYESILNQKFKKNVTEIQTANTRLDSGIEAEFIHALKMKLFDKARQVFDEETRNVKRSIPAILLECI